MQDRLGMTFQSVLGAVIPFFLGVICVIIANVPVSVTGGIVPPPVLALMPIYYWCLVRPDLMPPFAVLIIGILQDMFSGSPPGVWTASFVAAYALVDRERESFAGLSGVGALLGFAAAMLTAAATAYVIVAFYYMHLPPVGSLLLEIAVTVIFYIPVALLMGVIHRRLVGPLRSEF
jgi:rod shape-determining protein MreD